MFKLESGDLGSEMRIWYKDLCGVVEEIADRSIAEFWVDVTVEPGLDLEESIDQFEDTLKRLRQLAELKGFFGDKAEEENCGGDPITRWGVTVPFEQVVPHCGDKELLQCMFCDCARTRKVASKILVERGRQCLS